MNASVFRTALAWVALACFASVATAQTPKMGPDQSPATNPVALDRRTRPLSVRTTAAAPSADSTETGRMLRTARNSATKRVRGTS